MIKDKLTNIMIDYYNKADFAYMSSDLEKAYKNALQTYHLAISLKDSEHLYLSAFMIKKISTTLSQSYFNTGIVLYENERYAEAAKQLKYARKFARIGIKFEKPFNESQNSELLPDIDSLIEKNHAEISKIRIERLENIKDSIEDKFEAVKDFIEDLKPSSSYTYEYSEGYSNETSDEDNSTEELSEYKKEILNQAQYHYNCGINYYNKDSYHNAELLYSDAIDEFEECYKLAKRDFPELKQDALRMIAKCYYELGILAEDKADGYFISREFSLAEETYTNAISYYEKAEKNRPSGLGYDYQDDIFRAQEKASKSEHCYQYDD